MTGKNTTTSRRIAAVRTLLVLHLTLRHATAFSALSSFAGASANRFVPARLSDGVANGQAWTMYDQRDKEEFNTWTVLSNTEKWISSTLSSLNARGGTAGNNPYSRKEVSYACETYTDTPMIVAGIFRRIKELRQVGEDHSRDQQEEFDELTPREQEEYTPSPLRQTQVVVIPGDKTLVNRFEAFDALIQRINSARRNARDYVTDVMLDRHSDSEDEDDAALDWSIGINCAHMHPRYGERTPEQTLRDMQKEDEQGEIDLNHKSYLEQRMKARQSPYPTVVLELRAMPPMDFGASPTATAAASMPPTPTEGVTSDDVHKLEALFGKAAAFDSENRRNDGKDSSDTPSSAAEQKDVFYDSISQSLTEISALTPIQRAQNWMSENDPALRGSNNVVASFTDSSTAHVDEAYEFVFINLAMVLASEPAFAANDSSVLRQYLVMPRFLSYAATSFEKFKNEVENIWKGWPELEDKKMSVEIYHPELVDESRRSPMPVMVIEWSNV